MQNRIGRRCRQAEQGGVALEFQVGPQSHEMVLRRSAWAPPELQALWGKGNTAVVGGLDGWGWGGRGEREGTSTRGRYGEGKHR